MSIIFYPFLLKRFKFSIKPDSKCILPPPVNRKRYQQKQKRNKNKGISKYFSYFNHIFLIIFILNLLVFSGIYHQTHASQDYSNRTESNILSWPEIINHISILLFPGRVVNFFRIQNSVCNF